MPEARQTALEILVRLERSHRQIDGVFPRVVQRHKLDERDRRLVTELVYGVLRQRARLDWVLGQFCRKPLEKLSPMLRNILRLGAYQLLFLERVPPRAVVHEAVRLTRRQGLGDADGFVNAVLRVLQRTSSAIPFPDAGVDPVGHLTVSGSHPEWMVRRWLEHYGLERTEALCRANNSEAPLAVRTNTLRIPRAELLDWFCKQGLEPVACRLSPWGLKIRRGLLTDTQAHRDGWFYIQDEAAQLVVAALDPQPGEHILDTCAAPGGKTTHMAQLMSNRGHIVAVDSGKQRLERLRQNCARLGMQIVQPVEADIRSWASAHKRNYDRILVDAPCSGMGVLRRHPEGKWRKTEDLIFQSARRQFRILDAVSTRLRPGGVLVYSTCTTEPEENEQVVTRFLAAHPEYQIQDLREVFPDPLAPLLTAEGFLTTLWNQDSMDGFFVARLTKDPKE